MKTVLTLTFMMTLVCSKLVFKSGSSVTSNGFTHYRPDINVFQREDKCRVETTLVSFMATPNAITINEAFPTQEKNRKLKYLVMPYFNAQMQSLVLQYILNPVNPELQLQIAQLGAELSFFDKIDFGILVSKLAMSKAFKLYYEDLFNQDRYDHYDTNFSEKPSTHSLKIDNSVDRKTDEDWEESEENLTSEFAKVETEPRADLEKFLVKPILDQYDWSDRISELDSKKFIKLLVEDATKKLTEWKNMKTTRETVSRSADPIDVVKNWVNEIWELNNVDFSKVSKETSKASQPTGSITEAEKESAKKYADKYIDNGISLFALALKPTPFDRETAQIEYFTFEKAFFWTLRQTSDNPVVYVPQPQPAEQHLPSMFANSGGMNMNTYFRNEIFSQNMCSDTLPNKPIVKKSDIVVAGNDGLLAKLPAILIASIVNGLLKQSESQSLTSTVAQELLSDILADYLLAIFKISPNDKETLKEIQFLPTLLKPKFTSFRGCPLDSIFKLDSKPDQELQSVDCVFKKMQSNFSLTKAKVEVNNVDWNAIAVSLVDAASVLYSFDQYLRNYYHVRNHANEYLVAAVDLELKKKQLSKIETAKNALENELTIIFGSKVSFDQIPNECLKHLPSHLKQSTQTMRFGLVDYQNNKTAQKKQTTAEKCVDFLLLVKSIKDSRDENWKIYKENKEMLQNLTNAEEVSLSASIVSSSRGKEALSDLFKQLIGKSGLRPSDWIDKYAAYIAEKTTYGDVPVVPKIPKVEIFSDWNDVGHFSSRSTLDNPKNLALSSTTAVVALVTEEDETLSKAKAGLKLDKAFIDLNKNLYTYMNMQNPPEAVNFSRQIIL